MIRTLVIAFSTISIASLSATGQTTPAAADLTQNGGGEFARIIGGFAQSAASSTQPVIKAFIDGFWSRPLFGPSDPALGPSIRIWGDVRLNSVPQQISSTVGTFDLATQFANVKVNELVQTGEFLAGLQYRLPGSAPTLRLFDQTGRGRTTLSLIAAYGVVTPFSPTDNAHIYEIPTDPARLQLFKQQFGTLDPSYKAIALVDQDRNHFLNQYFAGIRVETHYFSDDTQPKPTTRPQHMLDVTLGQNEAITGGKLHGPVLRAEAFYAIPTTKTLPDFLYLFFTAQKSFGKTSVGDPLLLQPSCIASPCPAGLTNVRSIYDPTVYVATLPPSKRDVYRVGIGMDIIQLYQLIKDKATGTNQN